MNVELGTLETVVAMRRQSGTSKGPASKEAQRLRLYLGLILLDMSAIIAGFLIGNFARFGTVLDLQGLNMCLLLLPVYLGIAINSRAYTMDVLLSSRPGLFRSMSALFFSLAAILFVAFYLQTSADFSRTVFGIATVTSGVLICIGRYLFAFHARRRLGTSALSEVVIKDGLDCDICPGAHVVEARLADLRPDIADPLALDRLGRLLKNADRVVVACVPERRRAWAMALKGANIAGEVLSAELDELGAIGTNRYGPHATMLVSAGSLGLRDRALKRLLDVTVAAGALLVLSPLLIAVAIAVRLDSPGPVFFRQTRLGRGNQMFKMFKFRSMHAALSDGAGTRSTGRDDDRITRVGRFIRSTSIDELPQLINILKGDMSLVGPRPHALGSTAGDKLFWEVDSRYWHRHASKPGLTGLAQVRGYRGATHCSSDLVNRLQADLEYLAGWTIWRDMSIIVATFRVLTHKNAF